MARYSSTYFPSSYATAALTTLLIFGSSGFHGITTCGATRIHIRKKASTNFIATECSTTTYPELCVNTLTAHANTIQDNPSLLAWTAISVCLASSQSTSAVLSTLSTTGGLGARDAGAVGDCKTTMVDSADKLQRSLNEMGSPRGTKEMRLRTNNLQTWMSSALTDVTMCREGLDGSNMDSSVKSQIANAEQLASIALALVTRLSSPSP